MFELELARRALRAAGARAAAWTRSELAGRDRDIKVSLTLTLSSESDKSAAQAAAAAAGTPQPGQLRLGQGEPGRPLRHVSVTQPE